jgi:hypothetical protein
MSSIISNDYSKKDLSVSMLAANFYSIPLVIVASLIILVPFFAVWGFTPFKRGFNNFDNLYFFIPAMLIGILFHEFIHALSWKYFGNISWEKIKIGFQWKTITPYAHCKEPIKASVYRVGTLAPSIVLGFIPATISIMTGNGWLMTFGFLFTVAGGGDFLILWLIRNVDGNALIEDHPVRAGCYVIENTSIDSNESF